MHFSEKLQFYLLRLIYAKITEKIVLFSLLQIVIQAMPLIIEITAEKLGHSMVQDSKTFVTTMFFLAGTAWISVPSFIDTYPWKRFQTKVLKAVAYFMGCSLVIVTSMMQLSNGTFDEIRSSMTMIVVLTLVLAALYICLAHAILLKTVSVRLLWIHQAQFAGIYSAKFAGIFERSGLRVKINEPNLESHPVADFDASEDDFAIVSGIDVIRMLANHHQQIRSILPIVTKNPFVIYAKKDEGIHELKDLRGKKIGIQPDYETAIYFKAYVRKNGMDPEDFQYVKCDFDVDSFIDSDIVAQIGYVGCEPVLLRQRNVKLTEFHMAASDMDGYADTIVVEEAMLQSEKPVVRAFVDAVIKGWKFTAKNKEVALSFIMRLSRMNNKKFEKDFLNRMLTMINDGNRKLGDEQVIDEWEAMIKFLIDGGTIRPDHNIKANKIVYDI